MIKELFNKTESEIYDYDEAYQEEILGIFDEIPVGETDIELFKWNKREDLFHSDREDVDKLLGGVNG